MQFDITNLDKKLLIQTLFAHAAPLALGNVEYSILKSDGDNVDGLTEEECEEILFEFNKLDTGHIKLLDYHKGKPMKLNFEKKRNGQILTDSDSYDLRNGKYRFFEALLDIFHLDEILITKKGFREFAFSGQHEHLIRPKEQISKFKSLLKNSRLISEENYKYWVIDKSQNSYKSSYMIN